MGIVLEFGDNSTESSPISHRESSPHSSFSPRPNGHEPPATDENTTAELELSHQPPIAPITTAPPDVDHDPDQEGSELGEDEPVDEELLARVRRATLGSVLDRWRSRASQKAEPLSQQPQPPVPKPQEPGFVGRYSFVNGIDHGRRAQTLANITEEVTEEARGESVPQRVEKEEDGADRRQDSLRSLLDAPRRTGTESPELLATTVQEARDATRPISRQEQPSSDVPQHQDEGSAKNTMQGVFSNTPLPDAGVIPSIEPNDADTPAENDEEERTERPVVVSPEPQTAQTARTLQQTPERTATQPRTEPDAAALEAKHRKSLKHAARARELYLASKVFNHWADRTARRLEREAVARRHMIRFRYFKLWSQVPVSREPAIEQMKASTAVKKWQRIAKQDDDLERIAQEAAETHRRKAAGRVLEQWSYHRLQHVGRDMTASRTKSKALANWMAHVADQQALSETAEIQSRCREERIALDKWKTHTKEEKARAAASKRVGTAQRTFSHLREWWDQAELGRRATAYRQHVLTKKVCFAFDQWNLRARAQAFLWRTEYLWVIRACDKWRQVVEERERMQHTAERHFEGRAKIKVIQSLQGRQREMLQLTRMQNRALLYIRGTRMLEVFRQTIKQRKQRDRESVKRYLMQRYTQVSSARKKRNFFSALDKWRALAASDQAQAQRAYEIGARNDFGNQIDALHRWRSSTELDQRNSREAWVHYSRSVVATWQDHSQDLEQRDLEAWQIWANERQRNCVKEWSIASLQQSGQAHTASEVRKKHDRERRNRYMQHWRQLEDRAKLSATETEPLRTSTNFQGQGSYRSSWRALSGRRSVIRRNDRAQDFSTSIVETPTRWTGQANLMSGMMPGSSMAPLREVDEDAASSATGDDAGEMVVSPSKKVHDRRTGRFLAMSSTTPRAPVPLYLEKDFRDGNGDYEETQDAQSDGLSQRHSTGIPLRAAPTTQTPAAFPEVDNDGGPPSFLRPPVSTKSFGTRPISDRSFGLQPNTQSNSRTVASKSFGAKPSGLRYGVSYATEQTPSTKSVRIQSPKSFFVTTPKPTNAARPERHQRSQSNNHNTATG